MGWVVVDATAVRVCTAREYPCRNFAWIVQNLRQSDRFVSGSQLCGIEDVSVPITIEETREP